MSINQDNQIWLLKHRPKLVPVDQHSLFIPILTNAAGDPLDGHDRQSLSVKNASPNDFSLELKFFSAPSASPREIGLNKNRPPRIRGRAAQKSQYLLQ